MRYDHIDYMSLLKILIESTQIAQKKPIAAIFTVYIAENIAYFYTFEYWISELIKL